MIIDLIMVLDSLLLDLSFGSVGFAYNGMKSVYHFAIVI